MSTPARLLLPCLSLAVLAGCAVPAPDGVARLGDGVMQADNAQQAEAFCRTTGDPTRLLDASPAARGVRFRCD